MPQAPAPQGRPVCVLASQGAAVVKDECKQTRDSQRGTNRVPGHTAQQPVASGQLRFQDVCVGPDCATKRVHSQHISMIIHHVNMQHKRKPGLVHELFRRTC